MIHFTDYKRPTSLQEAWELNQKKSNRIIGGMLWLKMSHRPGQCAIDLSGLGLDTIEETDDAFSIGAMVTLRQLELHPGLAAYTQGAMKKSVEHIVGVQFRNCATIGGSLYGRYGFSDVLTLFLAMDTQVELFEKGILSLADYAAMDYDRDLLVRVIVKKTPLRLAYESVRITKTDFPVLTCAVSFGQEGLRTAIGARPNRAKLLWAKENMVQNDTIDAASFGAYAQEMIPVGSNLRGSAAYRKALIPVLIERCCQQVGGDRT